MNDRSGVLLKRLGIMRQEIYRHNHAGTVPNWDHILIATDRLYVLEYAIAERMDRVDKVLKEWDL